MRVYVTTYCLRTSGLCAGVMDYHSHQTWDMCDTHIHEASRTTKDSRVSCQGEKGVDTIPVRNSECLRSYQ